jgi:hypothetical protein
MTLLDLASRLGPDDASIVSIAEIIAKNNEIVKDIPWAKTNQLTSDKYTVRTENAEAYSRKLNEGIPASASKAESHTDTCIELATMGIVDMTDLALAPNAAQYLLSENKNKIAVLGEMLAESLFYGTDATAGVLGFSRRYNKLSSPQVIDAGGTGVNLTSIFFVKWDTDEVTGIYPKNTTAGIQHVEKTNELVSMKGNPDLRFLANVSYFSWFIGLKVRDKRFVSRVANVDTNAIMTDETARQKLFEYMIYAKNKIQNISQGRIVCYASPTVYSALEVAAFNKSNLALGVKDVTSDTRILTFSGIPLRRNDCQEKPEEAVK